MLPLPAGAPRPLLVIIGPSASGKSSVVRELQRRGLIRVHPTWTTRPPRDGEAGVSVEHRFVSQEVFDQLCHQDFFLETARLFGLPFRYGMPPIVVSDGGPIDTVMLRAPLVARMAAFFPDCLVYQISDIEKRTRRRMIERGSRPEEVAARMADNRREVAAGHRVSDRVFVNDSLLAVLIDRMAAALALDIADDVRAPVGVR
jgi:guanylate kinase